MLIWVVIIATVLGVYYPSKEITLNIAKEKATELQTSLTRLEAQFDQIKRTAFNSVNEYALAHTENLFRLIKADIALQASIDLTQPQSSIQINVDEVARA